MLPANIKLIIDLTLGDGWIGFRGTKRNNPYFICEHGETQIDYCKYKENLLQSFGYITHSYDKVNSNKTSKNFGKRSYRFYTNEHSDFHTAHKHLYNKNVKTVDKHLLRDLDAESLAYWFMDDGCAMTEQYIQKKDYRMMFEKKKVGAYKLSTNCFSLDENALIVDWLSEKFGIRAVAKTYKSYSTCIYVYGIKNKDLLRNTILPYVERVPQLLYKLSYPHTFEGISFTNVPRVSNFAAEETERNDSSFFEEDATVQA